ncbi:MAG: recombinase XerD [Deltaproteobacteria bacterium CG_4_10_14_3_um_filter_60_8]|nr:MAG: recombinase XerD [Deltaproteobacteria bacterium CG_4_10_14_3_um_filter_60_8]
MAKNGYQAVRWMRQRTRVQRGGNVKPGDGFSRQGRTLAALTDDYLEYLRVLNRTPDAVASRAKELKPFLAWCEERDLLDALLITRSILESYQRWLWAYRKKNGRPLGISTQRGHLGAIKSFFAWLCRQHVLPANPASEIEMPRAEKRLPVEVLTVAEVEAVLSQPDIGDLLGVRDRAMLELFYSTGIRRSELARLAVADLNREKRLLHVRHGKGQKQRMVPVGVRALAWLDKYLDDARPLLMIKPDEQGLFLTGYGEPFNADVLGRKVSGYIKQAGTGHQGGAHLLRHTCATHLLEGGADIRYIQQLLGHENLETTAIYTEVSIIQLQAVHARCHPAEQHRRTPPENHK